MCVYIFILYSHEEVSVYMYTCLYTCIHACYNYMYRTSTNNIILYVHLFTTQLWDASTGMELADFRGHSDMVTCCALSDSGRFVVSSSEDCTVRVSTHLYTCTVHT